MNIADFRVRKSFVPIPTATPVTLIFGDQELHNIVYIVRVIDLF